VGADASRLKELANTRRAEHQWSMAETTWTEIKQKAAVTEQTAAANRFWQIDWGKVDSERINEFITRLGSLKENHYRMPAEDIFLEDMVKVAIDAVNLAWFFFLAEAPGFGPTKERRKRQQAAFANPEVRTSGTGDVYWDLLDAWRNVAWTDHSADSTIALAVQDLQSTDDALALLLEMHETTDALEAARTDGGRSRGAMLLKDLLTKLDEKSTHRSPAEEGRFSAKIQNVVRNEEKVEAIRARADRVLQSTQETVVRAAAKQAGMAAQKLRPRTKEAAAAWRDLIPKHVTLTYAAHVEPMADVICEQNGPHDLLRQELQRVEAALDGWKLTCEKLGSERNSTDLNALLSECILPARIHILEARIVDTLTDAEIPEETKLSTLNQIFMDMTMEPSVARTKIFGPLMVEAQRFVPPSAQQSSDAPAAVSAPSTQAARSSAG
jgi:hypothetical protein